MQCPKCGFNNPQGARYCQRCANIFSSGETQHIPEDTKIETMPQGQIEKKQKSYSLTPGRYENEKNSTDANVPLRKWSQLFKVSINLTWSKKWRFVFLNIIPKLIVFVISLILGGAVFYFMYKIITKMLNEIGGDIFNILSSVTEILKSVGFLGFILGCIVVIAYIYIYNWSRAAYIFYLQNMEKTKKEILKWSFGKVWQMFSVYFLLCLVRFGGIAVLFLLVGLWAAFFELSTFVLILAGVVLVVLIIYSVVWGLKFGLAPYSLLVEGYKRTKALKRSSELTKGYRWPIFKRSILFTYFIRLLPLVFTVMFLLVWLLIDLGSVFSIIGWVIIIALFLFTLFILLLLEASGFVYDFDIYNNLVGNKTDNPGSREHYNLRQRLWTLVLLFFLFIVILLSAGLNLISSEGKEMIESGTGLFSGGIPYQTTNQEEFDFNFDDFEFEEDEDEYDFLQDTVPTNIGARSRDGKRIADINQIRTALELYQNDNNTYPVYNISIELGKDGFAKLCYEGFKNIGQSCSVTYMSIIPANPEPGGTPYIYTYKDELDYEIRFSLEVGAAFYKAGELVATPDGIQQLDEIEKSVEPYADSDGDGLINDEEKVWKTDPTKADTDSDGLDDKSEIYQWSTDPLNPDTDGDGYLDGEEVENDYNPLGSGKLK